MKSTRSVAQDKRRRKLVALLWVGVIAVGTMILLYYEMTAVLYILATLGVTAILVIVAVSDLAQGEKHAGALPVADDSAVIGSGIVSAYGTNKSS